MTNDDYIFEVVRSEKVEPLMTQPKDGFDQSDLLSFNTSMNTENKQPISEGTVTTEPPLDPVAPTSQTYVMTERQEFFIAQPESHRRHNRRPKAFISPARFDELLELAKTRRLREEDQPVLANALIYGLMFQGDFDALEAAETRRAQRRERNRRQWAKSSG